jgi:transcription elongation factor GreA
VSKCYHTGMQTPYRKPGKYSNLKPDPLLTEDKVRALENKVKRLYEQRPALAAEVARLAEMGDFSENAEYQHAKWQLRRLNSAIEKTEDRLNHAVVIKSPKQNNVVDLLHRVTVKVGGEQKIFQILGSSETNPGKGIISNNSPIGVALMGQSVGDKVKVKLADKEIEYEIIGIE